MRKERRLESNGEKTNCMKVQRSWNGIAARFRSRTHTHTHVDSLWVTSNQCISIPRLIAGLQACMSHSFESMNNSDSSSAFSNVSTQLATQDMKYCTMFSKK